MPNPTPDADDAMSEAGERNKAICIAQRLMVEHFGPGKSSAIPAPWVIDAMLAIAASERDAAREAGNPDLVKRLRAGAVQLFADRVEAVQRHPDHVDKLMEAGNSWLSLLNDAADALNRPSPEAPATKPDQSAGAAWHPKIGEEVRTTEAVHERYGEWRGVRLWIAEVRAERERGDRLNITVTEKWPMTKAASLTDAFHVGGNGPDDLEPIAALTDPMGGVTETGPSKCSCVVAFGQNRACPQHGDGTPWRADNPEADWRDTPAGSSSPVSRMEEGS